MNKKTCRRWFYRFKKGDFNLNDEPRAGCSKKLNSEQLQAAIDENSTSTTRVLRKTFNVSHMTIYREMKRIAKSQRLENWSHTICQKSISNSVWPVVFHCVLINFLDRIITGDKWILYKNVKRKRQLLSRGAKPMPQPRSELHPENSFVRMVGFIRNFSLWTNEWQSNNNIWSFLLAANSFKSCFIGKTAFFDESKRSHSAPWQC